MRSLFSFPHWVALYLVAGFLCSLKAQSSGSAPSEIASSTVPVLDNAVAQERLEENWTDADVFGLRAFSEPLVAESKAGASVEEGGAFRAAVNVFLLTRQPESLEAFLRGWPQSRWAAALEHNLGLLKYKAGYFTAAMACWESSWQTARSSQDPRLHALANQSLAELAGMEARLGRIEMLRPLLGILTQREVDGSARQLLDTSSDALHEMEARPDQSFKCGPVCPGRCPQSARDSRRTGRCYS